MIAFRRQIRRQILTTKVDRRAVGAKHVLNVSLMLDHCLQRFPNITFDQRPRR